MSTLMERLDTLDPLRRSYALQTLATHLAAAGEDDRLQSLFSNSAWMAARLASADYLYDSYIDDLEIAAQRARESAAATEAGLMQLFRLCLIRSSITTRAETAPTPLVAEAVKRGRWQAGRAISLARTRFEPEDAIELYWELLKLPRLTSEERKTLHSLAKPPLLAANIRAERLAYWQQLRAELEEVQGQWGDRQQSDRAIELLLIVDSFLKLTLRVEGIAYETSALEAASRKQAENIVQWFAKLEQSNPKDARGLVLSKFRYFRVNAARAYQAIWNVPEFDESQRQEATALFSHSLEPRVLTSGLAKLPKGAVRLDANAVERIAPFLSAEQCAELVQEIITKRGSRTKGNANRARALGVLAQRLPEPERDAAIREALQELSWVAETAVKESKKRVKKRDTKAAKNSLNASSKSGPILLFDDYSTTDNGIDLTFESYVEDTGELEIEYEPLEAAVNVLADSITPKLLARILGLAFYPREEYQCVSVPLICSLASHLEGTSDNDVRVSMIANAVETMNALPNELQRWHWPELALKLDDKQLDEALSPYGGPSDDMAQIRVLGTAAARSDGKGNNNCASTALEIAEGLTDPELQLKALDVIGPLVTSGIQQRAIDLAFYHASPAVQLRAVAALAPHLPVAKRKEVLARVVKAALHELTDNTQEDAKLAASWAAIFSQLDQEQREKSKSWIIAYTMDVQFIYDFKIPVKHIGPYLTSNDVQRLEGFRYDMPEELSFFLKSASAHLLTANEREDLYQQILTLPDENDQLESLIALARYLEGEQLASVVAVAWPLALNAKSKEFLVNLVPYLDQLLVSSTFSSSRTLSSLRDDDILCALAPRLNDDQKRNLLAAIAELKDQVRCARLLRDLSSHVNGSLRQMAGDLVLDLTEIDHKFSAAAQYLKSLGKQGWSIVAEKLWIERRNSREDVLNVVSTRGVFEGLTQKAALDAAKHVEEICREWDWS